MECNEVQVRLFRKIDGELSESENRDVDTHLARCSVCAREYGLIALPRRIASHIPPVTPSPFFYQKLKARIDGEAQGLAGWQMLWTLARHMIPAMAGITLALLSILAYLQWHSPAADMYRDYESVFIAEDQPRLMFATGRGEITDVSVLSAIADREPDHQHSNKK
jgi:anti-sigma factor RsiW